MSKDKKYFLNPSSGYLLFSSKSTGTSVEVKVADDTVWLTQKAISRLFAVGVPAISKHLKNIYEEKELDARSTISKMETVQKEGSREVTREIDFYNLDAIISVGYRVNSKQATKFRQWATSVLKEYTIKGYLLDKERLKNGQIFGKDYFDALLEEIREIRASERRFYQKITDIYATSHDYDSNSQTTKDFFAKVQNKLHFGVHKKTAAEVIVNRAGADKANMGLTNWKNSPDGKILKTDVIVAKNYLDKDELALLDRIVSMYLDYAEMQAMKNEVMSMRNWAEKLNDFLEFNDLEVLASKGSISKEQAREFALTEYEKYRTIQDKLFESDFDKEIKKKLE